MRRHDAQQESQQAMPSSPYDFVYTFPTRVEPDASGVLSLGWDAGVDPFKASHPVGVNDALQTIQLYAGALSPDECRNVIAMGEALPRTDGRVELGEAAYRVSHIAWIEPSAQTHWLFHKLGVLFSQAAKHYGFELTGFIDALQFTKYGPEQHFDWHMDLGPGATSARKLSMTIQLSANDDYTGGELEFVNAPAMHEARAMGAATFFPSYLAHRVTPVATGVRRSLVAWACGPTFR
jgi:PKHD-type hydroxylase